MDEHQTRSTTGLCSISTLVRIVHRMIMREIEDMEGFRIGGKVVNNIRYADDTVILAESEQLQQLINTVVTESELKGLYLNSTKSFYYGIFESKS